MKSRDSNFYALARGASDFERLELQHAIYGPSCVQFVDDAFIDIRAPRVVVDVGCGHGHMLCYLAQKFPDASAIGFDLCAEQLAETSRRAKSLGLPNICVSDQIESGIPLAGADLVYCRFVLMHQANRQKFLRSLHDLCSNEAKLIFAEPSLSECVTHPYSAAVHDVAELVLKLGLVRGIKYNVGSVAATEIGQTFSISKVQVTEPILRTRDEKSIILLSFNQIASQLLDVGLISDTYRFDLLANLESFVARDDCWCTGMRIFHILAKRKSATGGDKHG
jgi:SAM-dependent methyltransferase